MNYIEKQKYMGFFSSFSCIGKIYGKLRLIETDLTEMQRCLQTSYLRAGFNRAYMLGVQHLKELSKLVENSDDSVQCADFEFAGRKRPIAQHIFVISEYMKQMVVEYTHTC
ncbi:MAG: hypothetical protein K2M53_08885 [Muribaculaceae bacterium]|nr:hypothetical protein [Muribaculaceae bacterium]